MVMQVEKLTLENSCLRSTFKVRAAAQRLVSIFLRSFAPAVLCCRAQWVNILTLQAQVSATEEHGREAKATDTNLEQYVQFLEVWLRAN